MLQNIGAMFNGKVVLTEINGGSTRCSFTDCSPQQFR